MNYWHISVPAIGSASVYVQAETPEEALKKATESHDGMSISLCFQCERLVSEATVSFHGLPVESVSPATEDDALEWIKENG